MLNQLTAFLTAGSVQADLRLLDDDDVLIQPDLGDAVVIGEQAAQAMSGRLRRFAATPERWAEFSRQHHRDDITARPIGAVEIHHSGWVDDRIWRGASTCRLASRSI